MKELPILDLIAYLYQGLYLKKTNCHMSVFKCLGWNNLSNFVVKLKWSKNKMKEFE